MAKGISEIVGLAESVGKSRVMVYRALKILLCTRCSETISEGELFIRRSLDGQGLRILPQCQKCVPFGMRADDEIERRHSVLLESVLTPQPKLNEVRIRKPDMERDAVEMRLGPALRRCRQRTRS
jgi:hypothetical protein